ncbi:MAG: hypothetical protein KKA60_14265 [Proteobacteria bacterium]|nr:hypothetical protein [Pseudomonadota bacterium]
MTIKAKSGGLFLAVLLALLAAGCASGPGGMMVKVDAIVNPEVSGGRAYLLVSGMPNVQENDLLFRELSRYPEAALDRAGYGPAGEPGPGGLAILFSYGVGGADTVYSGYDSPLYEPGLHSWAAPVVIPTGNGDPDGEFSSRIIVVPQGPVWRGGASTLESEEVFTRWFALEAVAWEPWTRDRKKEPVWMVMVKSRGPSDDLRRLIPLMVRAAGPYLGKDTGGQVTVVIELPKKTESSGDVNPGTQP